MKDESSFNKELRFKSLDLRFQSSNGNILFFKGDTTAH